MGGAEGNRAENEELERWLCGAQWPTDKGDVCPVLPGSAVACRVKTVAFWRLPLCLHFRCVFAPELSPAATAAGRMRQAEGERHGRWEWKAGAWRTSGVPTLVSR